MSRGRISLLVFVAAVWLAISAAWTPAVPQAVGQSPNGAELGGIDWRSDLNAARQEAAQSGRNLLVHFWAPWCGPCRRLETTVFNQPAVAATLQQGFIPVKLNADDHRQIAEAFGVDRLPTDLILRPDGAVLAKMTSPQNPSAYVTQVAAYTAPGRATGSSAEQLAAAHRGQPPQTQPAYANLHAMQTETVPFPAAAARTHSLGAAQGGYVDRSIAANRTPAGYSPAGVMPTQQSTFANTPTAYGSGAGSRYGSRYEMYAASEPAGAFERPPLGGPSAQMAAVSHAPQIAPPPDGRYSQPTVGAQTQGPPLMAQTRPAGGVAPVESTARVGEANAPALGLEGFCPVTLKREQRWVVGDKRYGVIHRGCLYLFAGQREQQQFWADPDAFSPVLSGIDPVLALDNGATVEGRREHGVEYNGWIYLFSSESTLQHFSRNPERYAGGVRQAMQAGTGTTFR